MRNPLLSQCALFPSSESLNCLRNSKERLVVLLGPTDGIDQQTTWHLEVIQTLLRNGYVSNFFIPYFEFGNSRQVCRLTSIEHACVNLAMERGSQVIYWQTADNPVSVLHFVLALYNSFYRSKNVVYGESFGCNALDIALKVAGLQDAQIHRSISSVCGHILKSK